MLLNGDGKDLSSQNYFNERKFIQHTVWGLGSDHVKKYIFFICLPGGRKDCCWLWSAVGSRSTESSDHCKADHNFDRSLSRWAGSDSEDAARAASAAAVLSAAERINQTPRMQALLQRIQRKSKL